VRRCLILATLLACGARTELGSAGASDAAVDASDAAVQPKDAAVDAHDAAVDVHVAVNYALHFDGTELASVADGLALHLTQGTIEAWFRVDSTAGPYQALVTKSHGAGTDDSYAIWYQGGELLAGTHVTSPSGAVGFAWTPDDAWHYVAWTLDGATQALYLDGAEVASGAAAQPEYDSHPLLFGADYGGNAPTGFFRGDLDDIALWASVRTAQQIQADMNAEPPESAPQMIALWTCNEGTGQIAHDVLGAADAQLGTSASPDPADPTWIIRP